MMPLNLGDFAQSPRFPATICGGIMIRLDLSYFYRLGLEFTTVRNLQADQGMIMVWLPLDQLRNRIRQILSDPHVGRSLRSAMNIGTNLVTYLDDLCERDFEENYTSNDKANLLSHVNSFEIILTSELAVADAYFVVEKKPFNTLTLVSEGEALFPIDLTRKAPEAVYDLREAGKCIAFELPTASAFHIHRAVESILRRYWEIVTGNKPKPKQRNIGVYLKALTQQGCGDPKVIAALTQMKDLHRNVIAHPEETLDMEEAKALVGIATSVAAAMLKDLPFIGTEPPNPDDQSFPELALSEDD